MRSQELALCALGLFASTCNALEGSSVQLRPRQPAPSFKAKAVADQAFIDVSSEDYRGQWLVALFFPFDWTFVCPTELVQFSERMGDFQDIETRVLGISTDSHYTHLAWIKTPREDGGVGNLTYPLVADISKEMSRSFGVLVTDPEDEMYGAALRGLFIIDPKGIIRSIQINDDAVGRNVDETLRIIQAFQYADSHQGEACPASWQPGGRTIKTSPEGSREYFTQMFGVKP